MADLDADPTDHHSHRPFPLRSSRSFCPIEDVTGDTYQLDGPAYDSQQALGSPEFDDYGLAEAHLLAPPLETSWSSPHLYRSQPASTIHEGIGMTFMDPEVDMTAADEEPGLPDENMALSHLGMSPDNHAGKGSNSHFCNQDQCQNVQLVDRAGLNRHRREVHGPKDRYCHFPLCKRHTQGFSRQYNLLQHQRSCHKLGTPSRSRRASTSPRIEAMRAGGTSETDASPLELPIDGIGGATLEEQLQQLKALRAEMDHDIAAMERTLGVLRQGSRWHPTRADSLP